MQIRTCAHCQTPMKVIGSAMAAPEVYCSRTQDCYRARNRAKQRRFVAKKKAQGIDVYAPYREKHRKARQERVAAGLELPRRKKYPEQYKMDDQLRRARLAGAEWERFTTKEICERDGWICGICNESVEPGLRYPNPRSASLDHAIPLSKGGGHTRDNVRCSHLECNVRRGNRLDAE